jgi:molybdate transport system substrate-binding protein
MKRKYLVYFTLTLIMSLLISTLLGCRQQLSIQSPAITATMSPTTTSPTAIAIIPSSSANSPTNSPVVNKEISAFAGSSSKAAMDAAAVAFREKTGIKVNLTYGGSGTLLSQIMLSKTGDLFIPASPDYIDKATKDNIIYPDTETKLYFLVPAILVQKGNPQNITSLSDLAKQGTKVTIADPKSVPAGLYAYEILDYNKMLTSIGQNIVTYGDSNEKISSYVILKSVDAAIAWDNVGVQQPDKLDIVYLHPFQIPRLSYMSGAVTTFNKDKESSQKFLQYLTSTEGQLFFKKFGYYTTESEAKKFAPNAQIGGIYTLPSDYTPLVK